jgi:hypothetical protein
MTCGREFSNLCPEGCPPEPHDENVGMYYRIVTSYPDPSVEDFMSEAEKGNCPDYGSVGRRCNLCGVSLMKELTDAKRLMNRHQMLSPNQYVAEVHLTGGHGVVRQTHSSTYPSHHNWWIPVGVDPFQFRIHVLGERFE